MQIDCCLYAKVWQIMMNLLSNARKFSDPGGTITSCQTLLVGVADGGRAPSVARLLNCESAVPLQFTTQ